MLRTHRILIIDDHLLFAEGLRAQMRSMSPSAQVIIQTDGSKAIRQLERDQGFDLVILDINMPGIDGYKTLSILKNKKILSPVLMISANVDSASAKKAISAGARGYLMKSASPKTMIEAITELLNGRSYLDPSLPRLANHTPSEKKESSISPRTLEVLNLVAAGYSNKTISSMLDIAEPTVKWHVSRLFEIFDSNNRTNCVAKAARAGIVDIK